MNLPQPVQITMSAYVDHNGKSIPSRTFTISQVFPLIIDDHMGKTCRVMLRPGIKPMIVWQGEDYDNAGDYTQQQLEDRILEILGDDAQEKIQALYN